MVWLIALPLAAWLGVDRYRRLGHALTDRYLVSRTGSLDTRTVALQRDGIIGWRIRRTWFQRRVGLMTVTATTAAGKGGYSVPDIGEADGVALAVEAVPGLVEPFTEGRTG
jgi:putative membrane protein